LNLNDENFVWPLIMI